jgi:SAM-dependent methyltransferase
MKIARAISVLRKARNRFKRRRQRARERLYATNGPSSPDAASDARTKNYVEVIEKATVENLFPDGYLLANSDLKAACKNAEKHFINQGQHENRLQFTRDILGESPYRKEKFLRFKDIIQFDVPPAQDFFPLSIGTDHFSLDQYDAESANDGFGPFISQVVSNPSGLYLDLGCGLRRRVFANCLYLEVYPSVCADIIVGPECRYPLKDDSLDGIGCFAVLEHTRKPWLVAQEMRRMLKPGGAVFIDWPFLQPIHGYPSHYFNATREGLISLFTDLGFNVKETKTYGFQGPDYTINWILGKFVRDLPPLKRFRIQSMTISELLANPPETAFWKGILSGLDDRTIAEFACGNCLIANKSD